MMNRVIPGFSNYTVSIDGEVESVERIVPCSNGKTQWNQVFHAKKLKWRINKKRDNDTTVIVTDDNGVSHSMKISHLVALAFPEICGEWFEGCVVDHLDTNRLNNNAYNLRVTDMKGNMSNPLTRQHCANISDELRKQRSERMKGDNNPMCRKKAV